MRFIPTKFHAPLDYIVGLALMATLPGVPLYLAYGFETVEEGELTLTDGVKLEYASMTKSLNGSI